MRWAFWRSDKSEQASRTPPRLRSAKPAATSAPATATADLDLRALGLVLASKRNWIIVPTAVAAVLSIAAVNLVTPRYKSEARILIDGRENIFLRPNGEKSEERTTLDAEAVASQVQLLLSRDLAREIIKKNKLAERPEFDPVLQGFLPLRSLLALFGIGRDPLSLTPEERVLDAFFERYTAYVADKSRVVVIEFQSRDPDLAARVANSIAEGYLAVQQSARQEQAKSASQWLSGEIDSLRKKVAEAESRVEEFRSRSSLFVGTNNTMLSNQQMGELNTQLNNARAARSDAESKARLIKQMLQSGMPIEASEILNSELVRRLDEQRVTLRAQLAEQSATLLDGHPRIKELKAQLADLDSQLREEAGKISRALENDARIAEGRVDGLSASLEQLKRQATSSNGQDVQLRALEREAKAQRDLLESYLAKYREANTRENIEAAPADGRIISRATVSNTPAYPKKLPIVLIATLATLVLSAGAIATGELLRMTAPRAMLAATTAAAAPRAPAVAAFAPVGVAAAAVEPLPVINAPPIAAAAPVMLRESPPAHPAESGAGQASGRTEIERFADRMRGSGETTRKVTVLGTAAGEAVTATALTLGRLLSQHARIVVVDLAASSSMISAASLDPGAPGLSDLLSGEASFAQVITKDRLSRVHLVSAGRTGADRSLLQSPQLTLAIDALLRVYDQVVLDAGNAADLPAELLTAQARALVVPDASMSAEGRTQMSEQLKAAGFGEVTMLSQAPLPAPQPQVEAA